MEECARSFIMNGYSNRFLEKYTNRIPLFVDMVIKNNEPKKLLDLMTLTHHSGNLTEADQGDGPSHTLYSTDYCASQVTCPVQVISSSDDRIAGTSHVYDLAKAISHARYHMIEDCGHLAPFENPAMWRKLVLDFLSE